MWCLKYVFRVMDLSDVTEAEHCIGGLPTMLETQLVIDQREDRHRMRFFGHVPGLAGVHRHWLFAKYVLFIFQR